jgi:hypothetical protein
MGDRDGLTALEAGLDHAAHGFMARFLVAVLVAQVDFYPRNVVAESAQSALHVAGDPIGESLVNFDVASWRFCVG